MRSKVCFPPESGHSHGKLGRSVYSQNRKCREISNPEADLQLIAPPANRGLFKSRFAKARKMNVLHHLRHGWHCIKFTRPNWREVALRRPAYDSAPGRTRDFPGVTSRLHGHCVDASALRAEADVIGGKADVEIEGLLSARERTFSRQAQKVRL